jgi:hypothetical protein
VSRLHKNKGGITDAPVKPSLVGLTVAYRPPPRGSQLLLTHDQQPRSTNGLEQLEREIATVEWRLGVMKDRLAKLRSRKARRMAMISKVEAM